MALKGIILAGGHGTRLYPLTECVSKQLLPVFNKPMIYYPLSVMMLGSMRGLMVITTPQGCAAVHPAARRRVAMGAVAELRGAAFAGRIGAGVPAWRVVPRGQESSMILGDNIFFGHGLSERLNAAVARTTGATVFAHHVDDPERYGVVTMDKGGRALSIVKKTRSAQVQLCRVRTLFL